MLVDELAAIEGLARVDVLRLDKTGTLTDGHVTVTDVELLGVGWRLSGSLRRHQAHA